MKNKLPAILTAIGIAFLLTASFVYWQRTTPKRLSFDISETQFVDSGIKAELTPQALIINDLDIELPIFPAQVQKGKWEVTTKGVSYLASSPIPGEVGNSIIYGHNWSNLLGNLVNIKPGQEISVLFDDGSERKFVVKFVQIVTPEQISILDPSDDRRITLYTCIGFLDRKRFVVTAVIV